MGLVVESLGGSVSELRGADTTFTPHPHVLLRLFVMSTTEAGVGATDGSNDVFEALERYDWDEDVEFQAGLSAILGSNSSPEQATELALRARCFYFARFANFSIVFELSADNAKEVQHHRRLRSIQIVS